MIFDTDVIIWALRGNKRAAKVIDTVDQRWMSIVSYMELVQGVRDKVHLRTTRKFLREVGFHTLPLTENIGYRATIYMEEHALKSSLMLADALIAATAAENGLQLCSGNAKHFRSISELELKVFRNT